MPGSPPRDSGPRWRALLALLRLGCRSFGGGACGLRRFGRGQRAGCALLVSPDVLDLQVPTAGSVTTQLVLPVAPSLLGQVFHQQLVPIELAANGAILAFTASNALAVTIGTF